MPAITQLIPNYIGGVSSQADEKKSPGQVREIENGYVDPIYGLTKRNGYQFIDNLDTYTADDDELAGASWFFINRDALEAYFGCVTTNRKIRIWNAISRQEIPSEDIVFEDNSIDYLTEGQGHGDYDFLTIQDRTYIINKKKVVTEQPRVDYPLKTHATIKLISIEYLVDYTITITPEGGEAKTAFWKATRGPKSSDDPPEAPATANDVLSWLNDSSSAPQGYGAFQGSGIVQMGIPGMTVKQFATNLELECTTPFDIDVKAGISGAELQVYQDEIGNQTRLAATSIDGRRVKILNTSDESANYFVKFVANSDDTDGGTGTWEEGLGWDEVDGVNKLASPGLNRDTMPHQLFNTETDKFVFSEVEYTDRLVGSEESNQHPSFIDSTITYGFIYSNRLGFLSNENVIMSKAGDFDDFYFLSAQTIIASDPIDLNCSSIRPANLYAVIPQTQGLILFSENEQFNLYSDTDSITPLDAIIRSISNYESSNDVKPVDVGTNIVFISKTPSYTRTMAMTTRGQNNSPSVVDIGKVASEYVPSTIDSMISSSQNSFVAMTSQASNEIYFYRYFSDGEKDIMQAWFKWTLPGEIQTMVVVQDQVFTVVKNNGEYNLLGASIAQSATAGMAALGKVNPRIDMFYSPSMIGQTITYNSDTNMSTIPKPYSNSDAYNPIVIQVPEISMNFGQRVTDIPMSFVNDENFAADTGYLPKVIVNDAGDWLIKGDWTGKERFLLAGITYNFKVELPCSYYRTRTGSSDYTANLTLSRYRFSFGNTGFVEFKSKALGSDEWNKVEPVPDANYYNADSAPFTTETIITVPIYQKNKYFDFKIESDSPAPVSINSMMWEGQYSPKYYKRVG